PCKIRKAKARNPLAGGMSAEDRADPLSLIPQACRKVIRDEIDKGAQSVPHIARNLDVHPCASHLKWPAREMGGGFHGQAIMG
ncbi:hypothetical protein, partial [Paracoccus seriniphilus]|uniref:hypothetical protein n=1 Tax=Paracoccus seriniphilus TaxID=184748 RepID=UPI0035656D46